MSSANIINDIEKKLIFCGGEPETEGLDLYIKQNKLFGILFYSSVIPLKNQIIQKLIDFNSSLTEEEQKIKYIIVICEENEEDFKKSLENFKNLPCIVIPYENKGREILRGSFNIICFPSFIILDKKGKEIDHLNKNQILNINKNTLKGWYNQFSVPNLYKSGNYVLGDKGNVTEHSHLLIYSDNTMKTYGPSGWICDICKKNFGPKVPNFHCARCSFDVCDICYEKYKC